jgi:hypothetical protein
MHAPPSSLPSSTIPSFHACSSILNRKWLPDYLELNFPDSNVTKYVKCVEWLGEDQGKGEKSSLRLQPLSVNTYEVILETAGDSEPFDGSAIYLQLGIAADAAAGAASGWASLGGNEVSLDLTGGEYGSSKVPIRAGSSLKWQGVGLASPDGYKSIRIRTEAPGGSGGEGAVAAAAVKYWRPTSVQLNGEIFTFAQGNDSGAPVPGCGYAMVLPSVEYEFKV